MTRPQALCWQICTDIKDGGGSRGTQTRYGYAKNDGANHQTLAVKGSLAFTYTEQGRLQETQPAAEVIRSTKQSNPDR